jgi:hypothetical protein
MDITLDDVKAYAHGELHDPALYGRIAEAIEDNPEIADWYFSLLRDIEVPESVSRDLRQSHDKITRSSWCPIAWDSASQWGTGGSFTGGFHSPSLANRGRITVQGIAEELAVGIDGLASALKPAGIAVLMPKGVRRLTLGKPRPEVGLPPTSANAAEAEANYSLAAETLAIGRSHTRRKYFHADDGAGLQAWLEPGAISRTYVYCSLLSNARLPAVGRYRFWATLDDERPIEGLFQLKQSDRESARNRLRELFRDPSFTFDPVRPKLPTLNYQELADVIGRLQDANESDWSRVECARALGHVVASRVTGALARVLGDEDDDVRVRAACARALGEISNGPAFRELLKLLDTGKSSPEVRKACEEALGCVVMLEGDGEIPNPFDASIYPDWTLELTICDPRDVEQLTTDELRDLPRRAFEFVPLTPIDNGHTFRASVQHEQLSLWSDPDSVHLVQLAPGP